MKWMCQLWITRSTLALWILRYQRQKYLLRAKLCSKCFHIYYLTLFQCSSVTPFFFFFEVVHFPYCYCFVWLNSCLGVTRLWIIACIQSCQTGKPVFKLGVLNSKSRILFTLQWGFEKNFNNKQETILRNKHSTLHSPAVTLLKKIDVDYTKSFKIVLPSLLISFLVDFSLKRSNF